jgi:hypothetical protein
MAIPVTPALWQPCYNLKREGLMPVVLRVKGYKFWFYEADLDEPPHVHVGRESKEAKFWLDPIKQARAGRFRPVELREIERILNDHRSFLLGAWESEQRKRANRES